ncbi:hypothetical protein PTKIN_Ptkin04bG0059800 [Pterospermum kingtungense]
MPGNEVGDRIHNFLGQESLSQGQHHSQVIDGTWPGLSNNLLVGSQRQVGGPLVSGLKNFNVHQFGESVRGHGGQSSSLQHGLNFTQSGLRPDTARSQSQPIANGYMQGHQALQARQNETNFLGMDTTSRGLSILDSQIGNVPDLHKKNSLRLESTESPVNYDFFGGQQQISGQHPGMVQPLPRQQSGMTDTQLLQQHAILKQMQELQRQQLAKQQFQLSEARQLNPTNQPEHMMPNANWMLHGASPAMQGSSAGFMFSPEQGQVRLMGSVPQQVDQSFYGISTSVARGSPYQYSSVQMDKPLIQHVPAGSYSFPGNQYAMFSDQVGLQDGSVASGQGDQGQNVFGAAAGQGLNSVFHSENLQPMTIPPKNAVMQESHERQEHPGGSETSLETSAIQAASSQNVATLDPTEEKILFGSEDSVWDIFGKSTNMGSALDVTESFGSIPSMQSGSWSALMQSAVAETCSSGGVQEEWNGLGLQNSELPSGGNMLASIVNDGSKQQSAWADNNLQKASTLNSTHFAMPTDVNINLDCGSVPGVQQSGVKAANEHTVRMHNDSSQRFVQQLTEERSRWLDWSPLQKPVAESAQLFGNVARSPDVQVSAKNISDHQGIAAYDPHSQPHNKLNGWSFIESASRSGGAISKSQDIGSSLQPFQNSDHRGSMYEIGHGSALDCPVPDGNIESGNVNSGLGSPQVNKEGSDLDNVASITDSRTTRKESSQQRPNSHNLNHWKSIDSRGTSGLSRVPGKYQQNQDKNPQIFDSSGNDCLDNGVSEANVLENPNAKETSSDSFRSNFSYHTSTGGIRDNVWLDANDPRGGKQKSSVHVSSKPSGTRKFQYHPMGDLDVEVEPSYGTKSVTHLQEMPRYFSQGLKGHDQGYFGQSNHTGHAAGESTETEKGCVPGVQVDEGPSKSSNPGSASNRTFAGFMPGKTAPISQNMLELLQKVDQPREHGTATHLSSSEHNQSSEMPDTETSDGSVGQFQHSRPSTSHGFGLQLGPPSQKFIVPDHATSSMSSPRGFNSLNSSHVSSEVGRKGHTWLGPTASVQSSTHGASHGDVRNSVPSVAGHTNNKGSQYNILGNVSAGFTSDPYLKGHLQSQHVTGVSSQVIPNEYVNPPFGGLASQSKQADDSSERAQTSQLGRISALHVPKTAPANDLAALEASWSRSSNQNLERVPGQQFPVLEAMPASQPSPMAESSQQGAFTKRPNIWASVSAPQHLLGAQSSCVSQNLLQPHQHSNSSSETTLPGTKKLDDQIPRTGSSGQSEFPAGSAKPQSIVGEEQPTKMEQILPVNDASQSPASLQRDIEAFGRSLRPNNAVNQKYSLLHQVQALKNTEIDPSNRSIKRFKGPAPDSEMDAQQVSAQGSEQLSYGSNSMMRDASDNHHLVRSKMLNFSPSTGDKNETQLSANDMLPLAWNDSPNVSNANNSAANLRGEHSQISPQMAPSWFDRFGTFKNGKMLPIYDARKIAMMKATENALVVCRPSDNLHTVNSSEQVNAASASQLDNAWQSSNLMPIANEHISSDLLPPDITNQNLVVVKAKKRKSMTFELLPWHKEVTQGSQRPQNISVAEVEWAHAANRLIEKVEDEPEMIQDWLPALRSKRRLILTRQLMQQLLRAPPRVVLSAYASKNYVTVAYSVARSVLGDACSTACICESDAVVPPDSGSTLYEKLKGEKNQSILKAAEEFIIRSKILENDLQSVEKRASILDLTLECQDLEKFSVINRFARFHGRGQADGAETSNAIASSHKFFPQRYVTALPMPRNLPDRVQCLSL